MNVVAVDGGAHRDMDPMASQSAHAAHCCLESPLAPAGIVGLRPEPSIDTCT